MQVADASSPPASRPVRPATRTIQPGLPQDSGLASEDTGFSFLDLLLVLGNRIGWIAICALACGLAAAAYAFVLPNMYTASTVVLPPQNSSAGAALMSQLTNMGPMATLAGSSLGIKNPNDIYIAMFKSRTVESAMVQRFGLTAEYHRPRPSDARTVLEGRVDIQGAGTDGLIHLSVSDHDPVRAAAMANAFIEEYRRFSSALAITEASQRRLFFEQQLEQAKDNLGNAEEALKKTEQDTGMLQVDSQARGLIESAAALRAQISAKEVEIQGMRSYASEENPDLVMAEQQLAGWQAQLSRLTGNHSGTGDDLLLSKAQVPEAGLEYLRKARDVKYYDTIFELLAKQFEMAKLDEARQGSMIQVMDAAVPPDRKSSPHRALIILLGVAFGLLAGVFFTFVLEAIAIAERDSAGRERIARLRTMFVPRFLVAHSLGHRQTVEDA